MVALAERTNKTISNGSKINYMKSTGNIRGNPAGLMWLRATTLLTSLSSFFRRVCQRLNTRMKAPWAWPRLDFILSTYILVISLHLSFPQVYTFYKWFPLISTENKMTKKFELETEEEKKKLSDSYSVILENFTREKEVSQPTAHRWWNVQSWRDIRFPGMPW